MSKHKKPAAGDMTAHTLMVRTSGQGLGLYSRALQLTKLQSVESNRFTI